ncbi:Uncharacterised protein [Clostridium beijerinckii]|uniref:hypothetical protein n=1 Tax=Clostridium beijerinckii TaxID=1520 RepID=UPI000D859482|nr:hypothetical protein [Clostridium beijerinckii]SQB12453.1 Uncharacterised protein [Clostridium beijerinckii]
MHDLKEKIKTVEINLPKGKVVIVLPEDVPVDYTEIKRLRSNKEKLILETLTEFQQQFHSFCKWRFTSNL